MQLSNTLVALPCYSEWVAKMLKMNIKVMTVITVITRAMEMMIMDITHLRVMMITDITHQSYQQRMNLMMTSLKRCDSEVSLRPTSFH